VLEETVLDDMRRSPDAAPTLRLAVAGFAATAIAFGPARMGFGLFLPEFRDSFGLSTTLAGLIASGGFLAFLLALPVAAWLDARIGQRAPVVAGALSAAAGFALVAGASGPAALAAGVALAGASGGMCWTPLNDAAERVAPAHVRPQALSAVSTGTTLGVAAAGGLALAVSAGALDWRTAWAGFGLAAVGAAGLNGFGVPRGRAAPPESLAATGLICREARPLYLSALLFGAANAIYLAFAADRVAAAGGLPGLSESAAPGVIFVAYGAAGLIGLATGRIEARFGLYALMSGIFAAFAASLALVALTPGSWPGVVISAGLHGAAVMTISAALSFWSLRLFPGRGSLGFTAALLLVALGSALGPALAGMLVTAAGPQAAFLALAAPCVAATLIFAAPPIRVFS
jgi:predicted MFS family arabinose efflux permease